MSAAKTKAQGIIDDNAVGKLESPPPPSIPMPRPLTSTSLAVFSKSYCPYCNATKRMLSEMGAKYFAIELDQVGTSTFSFIPRCSFCSHDESSDDGTAIQSALAEMTGQKTVPNVWIDKKHIGGNSDMEAKRKELPELLKDAGAL